MNVILFFTEPLLNDGSVVKVQTPSGVKPGVSLMGCYSCTVPNELLTAFQAEVAAKGGKLEKKSEETLRYCFHGEHSCALADSLATPFMYR